MRPHTGIDGENVELPVWDANGPMTHTTAGDMARFMTAMMNDNLCESAREEIDTVQDALASIPDQRQAAQTHREGQESYKT